MGDTTPSSGTTTNPTSIIVQQDNSPFSTTVILDETNFSLWSQLMEMRIRARNKVGYLTGEAKKPEQTNLGYAIWITENHKEIDHRTNTQDGSVEGILQMHSMMARLRVHKFLNGLDAEFDQRQTMGSARLIPESSTMAVYIVVLLKVELISHLDILTWGTLGYGVKRHNLYFLELTEGGEKKFSHAFRTYEVEKARDNHLPNLEPRVFGCTIYTHIPKALRGKLDLCARRCVLVGYFEFQKGYRCYDPQNKKLYVTFNTSFRELEPYYKGGVTPLSLQGENDIEDTRMNRALGGETEFLELEAHEERLNAHSNISEQDIVTHEDNERIRKEENNNKEVANEDNEGIIPESTTISPLTNESSHST
ncbi:hypothetical protein KY290_013910 [Solanum tuberosum]|uniref:Retrotransposon Copia-like N-terminal domain-containing protein n=1 Tax=Solanum tuberosum TaxID=4113 RepID=A0ABQ7VN53_SOLTU|nr:hypothetical protein KY289_015563 [Solanum tuberosum]KAH0717301.1 hypothetical protein KY285_013332 [Solanum tuberosum]KAH0769929.1 hypothetical protein KY290_013910 [Solanum tuberosum]